MLVDGVTVMSLSAWITAGKDTMKAEGAPLTKGNYPTYLRAGGKFPAGSVPGPYRSATGRSATGRWFDGDMRDYFVPGSDAGHRARQQQHQHSHG
jgi:hypothetical protein